ncbi:MAG: phenylalanine--tRNA ligase subunit beta, partial [Candidatus Methylomirabilales bacterium]
MQRRLLAAGFRPISNVVDATNYALLVTGHPMHAFDLDTLEGARVVVRRARPGERLTTLDGTDRALDPDDLMIADAAFPVALAGVIGGADTQVSETTRRVLLESAYFDPASVFRTSKRQALRTEASARFERGADPGNVPYSAELACSFIQAWAGGKVARGAIDRYPEAISGRVAFLRPERANLVLGTEIEAEEMSSALGRLGLTVSDDDGVIRAGIPTNRPDLVAEEDLIEEVARLLGYERIPATLPSGRNRTGGLTREQSLLRRVRAALAGAGLWEAYTSTLIGLADLARWGFPDDHEASRPVGLANPLVRDESLLRPSLLPGLAAALSRNVARRNLSVRLLEIGRVFLPSEELLPREPLRLCVALHGPLGREWHTPDREMDFFDAKGILEALFEAIHVRGVSFAPVAAEPFHPGRAAVLGLGERRLGILGELSSEALARWDLPHRAVFAEVDLEAIIQAAGDPLGGDEAPRFPAVLIDLAVSVPREVPAAELEATARSSGGDILEDVRIFDLYVGAQAGEGRKSIALALSFRRADRTLTEAEALAARDAIAAAIAERHRGEVRM